MRAKKTKKKPLKMNEFYFNFRVNESITFTPTQVFHLSEAKGGELLSLKQFKQVKSN